MTTRPTPLQVELKQTKPFRSPGHEALVDVAHTADVVKRRYGLLLEPHGVTLQQYNVLRILRGAGEDGLPTLEIASRMIEQTPGITRLVDRLEARGWVTRERSKTDRREVHCRATPDALALLERIQPELVALEKTMLAGLSTREQETLVSLLDRLRDAAR